MTQLTTKNRKSKERGCAWNQLTMLTKCSDHSVVPPVVYSLEEARLFYLRLSLGNECLNTAKHRCAGKKEGACPCNLHLLCRYTYIDRQFWRLLWQVKSCWLYEQLKGRVAWDSGLCTVDCGTLRFCVGLQRDVVYLGWPSYMSPNAGVGAGSTNSLKGE